MPKFTFNGEVYNSVSLTVEADTLAEATTMAEDTPDELWEVHSSYNAILQAYDDSNGNEWTRDDSDEWDPMGPWVKEKKDD